MRRRRIAHVSQALRAFRQPTHFQRSRITDWRQSRRRSHLSSHHRRRRRQELTVVVVVKKKVCHERLLYILKRSRHRAGIREFRHCVHTLYGRVVGALWIRRHHGELIEEHAVDVCAHKITVAERRVVAPLCAHRGGVRRAFIVSRLSTRAVRRVHGLGIRNIAEAARVHVVDARAHHLRRFQRQPAEFFVPHVDDVRIRALLRERGDDFLVGQHAVFWIVIVAPEHGFFGFVHLNFVLAVDDVELIRGEQQLSRDVFDVVHPRPGRRRVLTTAQELEGV